MPTAGRRCGAPAGRKVLAGPRSSVRSAYRDGTTDIRRTPPVSSGRPPAGVQVGEFIPH